MKVSSTLAGAAPITIPSGAKGDRAASALTSFRRYRDAGELFEDLVRGFCPGEWLCVPVVIGDVALDGVFQVGNGFEDT